eukprot:612581-Prymnesium_polylepis.1
MEHDLDLLPGCLGGARRLQRVLPLPLEVVRLVPLRAVANARHVHAEQRAAARHLRRQLFVGAVARGQEAHATAQGNERWGWRSRNGGARVGAQSVTHGGKSSSGASSSLAWRAAVASVMSSALTLEDANPTTCSRPAAASVEGTRA